MKQISNDYICYYCLGCIAEEDENFQPKKNCKNIVPGYSDWQERYYEVLKEKKSENKK